MIVTTNNKTRKEEFFFSTEKGKEILTAVRSVFDIDGNIISVSYDGGSQYGVYFLDKPTVSPVDLSEVELDPNVNNLISFKINMENNTIRTKIYRFGNSKNISFHKPIITTGEYLGEEAFSVYYTDEGLELNTKEDLFRHIYAKGFRAVTIDGDTISDESVYYPKNVPS